MKNLPQKNEIENEISQGKNEIINEKHATEE